MTTECSSDIKNIIIDLLLRAVYFPSTLNLVNVNVQCA